MRKKISSNFKRRLNVCLNDYCNIGGFNTNYIIFRYIEIFNFMFFKDQSFVKKNDKYFVQYSFLMEFSKLL